VAKRLLDPTDHTQLLWESEKRGVEIHRDVTKDIASSAEAGILRLDDVIRQDEVDYAIFQECESVLSEKLIANASESVTLQFLKSMVCALQQLANKKIAHLDIKPSNILIPSLHKIFFVLSDF